MAQPDYKAMGNLPWLFCFYLAVEKHPSAAFPHPSSLDVRLKVRLRSSGLRISRTGARNSETQGWDFICYYARSSAASCGSRAIVFGGLASGHF
jgi:hypothetical protein